MPPLEWLMLISHSAESRIAEEQMSGHVEKFQDRIAEMERLTLNEKKKTFHQLGSLMKRKEMKGAPHRLPYILLPNCVVDVLFPSLTMPSLPRQTKSPPANRNLSSLNLLLPRQSVCAG